MWAAVVPTGDEWLAVNGLAEQFSSWPSASGTDAAVDRNIDRFSLASLCTAEGGFPGGPSYNPPPDE